MLNKIFLKKIIIAMLVAVSFAGTTSFKKSSSVKAMNFSSKNSNKNSGEEIEEVDYAVASENVAGEKEFLKFTKEVKFNKGSVAIKNTSKRCVKITGVIEGLKKDAFFKDYDFEYIEIDDKKITDSNYSILLDPEQDKTIVLGLKPAKKPTSQKEKGFDEKNKDKEKDKKDNSSNENSDSWCITKKFEDIYREGYIKIPGEIKSQKSQEERTVLLKNNHKKTMEVTDVYNGLKNINFGKDYVLSRIYVKQGRESYIEISSNVQNLWIDKEKEKELVLYFDRIEKGKEKNKNLSNSLIKPNKTAVTFKEMKGHGFVTVPNEIRSKLDSTTIFVTLKNRYGKKILVTNVLEGLQEIKFGDDFVFDYFEDIQDKKQQISGKDNTGADYFYSIILENNEEQNLVVHLKRKNSNSRNYNGGFLDLKKGFDSRKRQPQNEISILGLKRQAPDSKKEENKKPYKNSRTIGVSSVYSDEDSEDMCTKVDFNKMFEKGGVTLPKITKFKTDYIKERVVLQNKYGHPILVTDIFNGLKDVEFGKDFVLDYILDNGKVIANNSCGIWLQKGGKKSLTVYLKRKGLDLQKEKNFVEKSKEKEKIKNISNVNLNSGSEIRDYITLTYDQMKDAGCVELLQSKGLEIYIKNKLKKHVILRNKNDKAILVTDIFNGLKKTDFGEKFVFDDRLKVGGKLFDDDDFEIWLEPKKEVKLEVYLKRKKNEGKHKRFTYEEMFEGGFVKFEDPIEVEDGTTQQRVVLKNNFKKPIIVRNIFDGLENFDFGKDLVLKDIILNEIGRENIKNNKFTTKIKPQKDKSLILGFKRKRMDSEKDVDDDRRSKIAKALRKKVEVKTFEEFAENNDIYFDTFIHIDMKRKFMTYVRLKNNQENPVLVTNIFDYLKKRLLDYNKVLLYINLNRQQVTGNNANLFLDANGEKELFFYCEPEELNSEKEKKVNKKNKNKKVPSDNSNLNRTVKINDNYTVRTCESMWNRDFVDISKEVKTKKGDVGVFATFKNIYKFPIRVVNILDYLKKAISDLDYFKKGVAVDYIEFGEKRIEDNSFNLLLESGEKKSLFIKIKPTEENRNGKEMDVDGEKLNNDKSLNESYEPIDYERMYAAKNVVIPSLVELEEKIKENNIAGLAITFSNNYKKPIEVRNIVEGLKKNDLNGDFVFDYLEDSLIGGKKIENNEFVLRLAPLESKSLMLCFKPKKPDFKKDVEEKDEEVSDVNKKINSVEYKPVALEKMCEDGLVDVITTYAEEKGTARCLICLKNYYDESIEVREIFDFLKKYNEQKGHELKYVMVDSQFFTKNDCVLRLKRGKEKNLIFGFESAKIMDFLDLNLGGDEDSEKKYEQVPYEKMRTDKNVDIKRNDISNGEQVGRVISFKNSYGKPIEVTGIFDGLKGDYFGENVVFDYFEDDVVGGNSVRDNNFKLRLESDGRKELMGWFKHKKPDLKKDIEEKNREEDYEVVNCLEMLDKQFARFSYPFEVGQEKAKCYLSFKNRYNKPIKVKDIFIHSQKVPFEKNAVVCSVEFDGKSFSDNNFMLPLGVGDEKDLVLVFKSGEKNKNVKAMDFRKRKFNGERGLKKVYESVPFSTLYQDGGYKNFEFVKLDNEQVGQVIFLKNDKYVMPIKVTNIFEFLSKNIESVGEFQLSYIKDGLFDGEVIKDNKFTLRLDPSQERCLTIAVKPTEKNKEKNASIKNSSGDVDLKKDYISLPCAYFFNEVFKCLKPTRLKISNQVKSVVTFKNIFNKPIEVTNIFDLLQKISFGKDVAIDYVEFDEKKYKDGNFTFCVEPQKTKDLVVVLKRAEKNENSGEDLRKNRVEEVSYERMRACGDVELPEVIKLDEDQKLVAISFKNTSNGPIKVTNILDGLKKEDFGKYYMFDYIEDHLIDGQRVQDDNFTFDLDRGEKKLLMLSLKRCEPKTYGEMWSQKFAKGYPLLRLKSGNIGGVIVFKNNYEKPIVVTNIFNGLKKTNFDKDKQNRLYGNLVLANVAFEGKEVKNNDFNLHIKPQEEKYLVLLFKYDIGSDSELSESDLKDIDSEILEQYSSDEENYDDLIKRKEKEAHSIEFIHMKDLTEKDYRYDEKHVGLVEQSAPRTFNVDGERFSVVSLIIRNGYKVTRHVGDTAEDIAKDRRKKTRWVIFKPEQIRKKYSSENYDCFNYEVGKKAGVAFDKKEPAPDFNKPLLPSTIKIQPEEEVYVDLWYKDRTKIGVAQNVNFQDILDLNYKNKREYKFNPLGVDVRDSRIFEQFATVDGEKYFVRSVVVSNKEDKPLQFIVDADNIKIKNPSEPSNIVHLELGENAGLAFDEKKQIPDFKNVVRKVYVPLDFGQSKNIDIWSKEEQKWDEIRTVNFEELKQKKKHSSLLERDGFDNVFIGDSACEDVAIGDEAYVVVSYDISNEGSKPVKIVFDGDRIEKNNSNNMFKVLHLELGENAGLAFDWEKRIPNFKSSVKKGGIIVGAGQHKTVDFWFKQKQQAQTANIDAPIKSFNFKNIDGTIKTSYIKSDVPFELEDRYKDFTIDDETYTVRSVILANKGDGKVKVIFDMDHIENKVADPFGLGVEGLHLELGENAGVAFDAKKPIPDFKNRTRKGVVEIDGKNVKRVDIWFKAKEKAAKTIDFGDVLYQRNTGLAMKNKFSGINITKEGTGSKFVNGVGKGTKQIMVESYEISNNTEEPVKVIFDVDNMENNVIDGLAAEGLAVEGLHLELGENAGGAFDEEKPTPNFENLVRRGVVKIPAKEKKVIDFWFDFDMSSKSNKTEKLSTIFSHNGHFMEVEDGIESVNFENLPLSKNLNIKKNGDCEVSVEENDLRKVNIGGKLYGLKRFSIENGTNKAVNVIVDVDKINSSFPVTNFESFSFENLSNSHNKKTELQMIGSLNNPIKKGNIKVSAKEKATVLVYYKPVEENVQLNQQDELNGGFKIFRFNDINVRRQNRPFSGVLIRKCDTAHIEQGDDFYDIVCYKIENRNSRPIYVSFDIKNIGREFYYNGRPPFYFRDKSGYVSETFDDDIKEEINKKGFFKVNPGSKLLEFWYESDEKVSDEKSDYEDKKSDFKESKDKKTKYFNVAVVPSTLQGLLKNASENVYTFRGLSFIPTRIVKRNIDGEDCIVASFKLINNRKMPETIYYNLDEIDNMFTVEERYNLVYVEQAPQIVDRHFFKLRNKNTLDRKGAFEISPNEEKQITLWYRPTSIDKDHREKVKFIPRRKRKNIIRIFQRAKHNKILNNVSDIVDYNYISNTISLNDIIPVTSANAKKVDRNKLYVLFNYVKDGEVVIKPKQIKIGQEDPTVRGVKVNGEEFKVRTLEIINYDENRPATVFFDLYDLADRFLLKDHTAIHLETEAGQVDANFFQHTPFKKLTSEGEFVVPAKGVKRISIWYKPENGDGNIKPLEFKDIPKAEYYDDDFKYEKFDGFAVERKNIKDFDDVRVVGESLRKEVVKGKNKKNKKYLVKSVVIANNKAPLLDVLFDVDEANKKFPLEGYKCTSIRCDEDDLSPFNKAYPLESVKNETSKEGSFSVPAEETVFFDAWYKRLEKDHEVNQIKKDEKVSDLEEIVKAIRMGKNNQTIEDVEDGKLEQIIDAIQKKKNDQTKKDVKANQIAGNNVANQAAGNNAVNQIAGNNAANQAAGNNAANQAAGNNAANQAAGNNAANQTEPKIDFVLIPYKRLGVDTGNYLKILKDVEKDVYIDGKYYKVLRFKLKNGNFIFDAARHFDVDTINLQYPIPGYRCVYASTRKERKGKTDFGDEFGEKVNIVRRQPVKNADKKLIYRLSKRGAVIELWYEPINNNTNKSAQMEIEEDIMTKKANDNSLKYEESEKSNSDGGSNNSEESEESNSDGGSNNSEGSEESNSDGGSNNSEGSEESDEDDESINSEKFI